MNQISKYFITGVAAFLLCLAFHQKVYASNEAKMEKGVVIYVTTDTTATAATTWRTEGFTVKKEKTFGDPTAMPKGKFMLTDGEKRSTVDGNITTTTFTFPEAKVSKEFDQAGIDAKSLEQNGGVAYLNGVFRVYSNGRVDSGYYNTLNGIKNARGWANKNDFDDHFDIKLRYDGKKVPVYLTTMRWSSKNGYVVDKRELIGKFSSRSYYSTTTSGIPADYKSPVSGSKLYLFQTHLAKWSDKESVHSNGTYRTMRDKLKTSINPNVDWEGYKSGLQALRNRKYEVTGEGIEIVCVYKNQTTPPEEDTDSPDGSEGSNDISRDIIIPYTACTINSNTRGSEIYNSVEAIPTSEYQYVNVNTGEYLTQYTFRQHHGVKYYKQKVSATSTQMVDVPRSYSYWKIVDLNVYALSSVVVENRSLPSGKITLTPAAAYYKAPYVSYNIYDSNIMEPASGGTSVGEIKVRNDALYFNGTLLMSGEWLEGNTKAPELLPPAPAIHENTLYQAGLLIDANAANGDCDTNGLIRYTRISHYGDDAEGNMVEVDVENVNEVILHTPTICDAKIYDGKNFNQMLEPDRSVPSLVLDTNFKLQLPTTGTHDLNLKGYQTREYAKFIAKREVKFPFDVFLNGTYNKAGTWISIHADETQFYLPVWVEEGIHTMEFRSRAINSDANQGLSMTEELANLSNDNYTATDTMDIQVSGRLFGFNVYDISDYPIWRSAFRQPGSMEFTNFNYTTGTKDRNGKTALDAFGSLRNAKYTLPIVNGSHPTYLSEGSVRTGYYNRFSVQTMGEFDGKEDYIQIKPKFYFVGSNGSTREERQEVDLYYTEWFQSDNQKHILVKVGSEQDKKNTHRIDRDNPYLGVRGGTAPIRESRTTWTFGDIKLTGSLMLQSGTQGTFQPQVRTTDSSMLEKQKKSVQTWFGEYYLPANLYVCPKGFDVDQYALDHNGLDFSEDFWLKKGYIVVNFSIEAVKDGKPYLSYINKENRLNGGYCNMWEMEGGVLSKTDSDHYTFEFMYGDYLMYYADPNKSVTNDYKSGGIY